MTTYTESFNKADGSLGPDLTWGTPLLGSPQVVSGAFGLASAGSGAALAVAPIGTSQSVSVTLSQWTHDASSVATLWLCCDNQPLASLSGVKVAVTGAGLATVTAYFAGVGTDYLTDQPVTVPSQGDVLTVTTRPTTDNFTLNMAVNGTHQFSLDGFSPTLGSYSGVGVAWSANEARLDSFSVHSLEPTFTPPGASEVPPTLDDHPGNRLFKFFRARPAGHNVFLYKEGSLSAVAHGRVDETDPITLYDSDGVATTNGWDDVEFVFWGGTNAVTVTAAQATALAAAGYTVEYA